MSIVDGISFEVEKVDRGYWRWIGTSPVYGLVEGGDDAYRTKAEATAALRYYLEHRAEDRSQRAQPCRCNRFSFAWSRPNCAELGPARGQLRARW